MNDETRHKLIDLQVRNGVPPERAAANVVRQPAKPVEPLAPLSKYEQIKQKIVNYGRSRYWWE